MQFGIFKVFLLSLSWRGAGDPEDQKIPYLVHLVIHVAILVTRFIMFWNDNGYFWLFRFISNNLYEISSWFLNKLYIFFEI